MKILVTGGFGYLGGRIAQSLSSEGHEIVLGSRKKEVSPSWLRKAECAQINWNDDKNLRAICDGIDVIIHSAGMNAQDSLFDPLGAINFNGVATAKLVKASQAAEVCKFIYISTAHVYCSPLQGEITETSLLLNKHPYATSHREGEKATLSLPQNIKNFKGTVLRLSNGVGAPAHRNANCWMLAVNDFCRQAIENRRIEVNSPQWVERDFIPITLLCNTIGLIVNSIEFNEDIINVSSSKNQTLLEIVEIITKSSEKLFGFKPEVVFKNKGSITNKNTFKISNNKLREIIDIEDNFVSEIDRLLLKCKEWFG